MQHVPYDARNREVLYITDPPNARTARRKQSNGFGVAGFVLSILGFFTCGVLSPLGLLFSTLGIFRAPRGLATAGLVMGMAGTGAVGLFVAALSHESHVHHDVAVRHYESHRTSERINQAKQEIEQYRLEHEGRMPEGVQGNKIVVLIEDGWKTSLGYEPDDTGYVVRSAGPDHQFNTYDDITSRVAIPDARIDGIVSLDERVNDDSTTNRPPSPQPPSPQPPSDIAEKADPNDPF